MAEKVIFVTGMFFLLFLIISKVNSPVGFADVKSNVDGVKVFIDDVPRGSTEANQPLEISLVPGKHTILATKDGYTGYVSAFYVEKGETKEIDIELEKLNG